MFRVQCKTQGILCMSSVKPTCTVLTNHSIRI
uniref:Uncharacterized protein n=1 Tax=Arundo donax TaxID=35708 RepID=A0A0A8YR52_ARUDO